MAEEHGNRKTAAIIELDDLEHSRHSHEFVGAEHGDVPFSIILVHSEPGVGPKLHRHPYAEVFVVESARRRSSSAMSRSSSMGDMSSSARPTCRTASRTLAR